MDQVEAKRSLRKRTENDIEEEYLDMTTRQRIIYLQKRSLREAQMLKGETRLNSSTGDSMDDEEEESDWDRETEFSTSQIMKNKKPRLMNEEAKIDKSQKVDEKKDDEKKKEDEEKNDKIKEETLINAENGVPKENQKGEKKEPGKRGRKKKVIPIPPIDGESQDNNEVINGEAKSQEPKVKKERKPREKKVKEEGDEVKKEPKKGKKKMDEDIIQDGDSNEGDNGNEKQKKPKKPKEPKEPKEPKVKKNGIVITPDTKGIFSPSTYRRQELKQLNEQYPIRDPRDPQKMIKYINSNNPLHIINKNVHDQGPIMTMDLSVDGLMLATFCSYGLVKIWDVETWECIYTIKDRNEINIDEFYCGSFTPTNTCIAIGGKLKSRTRWSKQDDDNHILPTNIKIFDLVEGKVVTQLAGHNEEILSIKAVQFKGENYFLSTSQDGYLIKWKMSADWKTLIQQYKMDDPLTCMAFTVSFIPNTSNKYFLGACDDVIRLYDFEATKLLQTFSTSYSSYCDCLRFISYQGDSIEDESEKQLYFISRGVEVVDEEGVQKHSNFATLHKLVFPETDQSEFFIEEIKRFTHEYYFSNSWLIKVASNGRYLAAPTIDGQVFIFNLKTSEVCSILRDHQDREVRDVIFHPTRPLLLTCGDDGTVKMYESKGEEQS